MEIFLTKQEFMLLILGLAAIYISCLIRSVYLYNQISTMYSKWEKLSYLAANIILTITFTTVFFNSYISSQPINLNDYSMRAYKQIDINNVIYNSMAALDKNNGKIYEINSDDIHRLESCANSQAYIVQKYDTIIIFFIKIRGQLEKESIIIDCKKEKNINNGSNRNEVNNTN